MESHRSQLMNWEIMCHLLASCTPHNLRNQSTLKWEATLMILKWFKIWEVCQFPIMLFKVLWLTNNKHCRMLIQTVLQVLFTINSPMRLDQQSRQPSLSCQIFKYFNKVKPPKHSQHSYKNNQFYLISNHSTQINRISTLLHQNLFPVNSTLVLKSIAQSI